MKAGPAMKSSYFRDFALLTSWNHSHGDCVRVSLLEWFALLSGRGFPFAESEILTIVEDHGRLLIMSVNPVMRT